MVHNLPRLSVMSDLKFKTVKLTMFYFEYKYLLQNKSLYLPG